jgi:hypothetical protein
MPNGDIARPSRGDTSRVGRPAPGGGALTRRVTRGYRRAQDAPGDVILACASVRECRLSYARDLDSTSRIGPTESVAQWKSERFAAS